MAKGVHVEMLWGTTDVPRLSWRLCTCLSHQDCSAETCLCRRSCPSEDWNGYSETWFLYHFDPLWSILYLWVLVCIGAYRKTAVPKRSFLPARALRHIRIVVPNPTTCITYHHLPLGILRHILIAVPALRHLDARLLASIFALYLYRL